MGTIKIARLQKLMLQHLQKNVRHLFPATVTAQTTPFSNSVATPLGNMTPGNIRSTKNIAQY